MKITTRKSKKGGVFFITHLRGQKLDEWIRLGTAEEAQGAIDYFYLKEPLW